MSIELIILLIVVLAVLAYSVLKDANSDTPSEPRLKADKEVAEASVQTYEQHKKTTSAAVPTEEKTEEPAPQAAPKKKIAPKKKVAPKKKTAPKKKVAPKKKTAPKKAGRPKKTAE